MLVNSLASSASLLVVRSVLAASRPNSASARSAAAAVSAPMIWGSVRSSSSAWPSAIRSGQNATSTPQAAVLEGRRDVLGRARVDGAAQDDQRAVAELRGDLVDRPLEHAHRRAEELVDGRPDDEQHGVGAGDDLGVGAELEAARREDVAEQLVGAVLEERHLASADPVERRRR